MHNVKKLSQEKRAQKRLADVERARKYNALSRAAMARRSERIYDEESLVACEQVLSINPEMNTLWNFRREILAAMYPDGRDDARRKPCEREFRLTQECLGLNPKSYPVRSRSTRGVQCAPRPAAAFFGQAALRTHRTSPCRSPSAQWEARCGLRRGRLPTSHLPNMQVWHHRQWVMEWGSCTWQHPVDLKLTAKLLMMDERNFHCWTYRRFVARAGCTPCTARATATRDGTGPWQQLAQVARCCLIRRRHGPGARLMCGPCECMPLP